MSPDAALRHVAAPPAGRVTRESGRVATAPPIATARLAPRRRADVKAHGAALLRLLVVLSAHGAALAACLGGTAKAPALPTQAIEVSLVAPAPVAEPAPLPPPEPAAKPMPPAPPPPPEPVAKPPTKPVAKPLPKPVEKPVAKPAPRPAPKPPRPAPAVTKAPIIPPQPAVDTMPMAPADTAKPMTADKPATRASEHSAARRGTPSPVSRARFDAAYLDNPRPVYPRVSRRTGEQGRVLLRVRVEASGAPSNVQLHTSSGSRRLDKAALEAVNRWRFEPAKRGETAIASWIVVPIDFKLEGS